MQLTGPIFLFLFLPLSVLLVLPFSGKRRAAALLVCSLLWYGVANRQNPVGLAVIGGLSLLCWLLTLPRGARRLRCSLGVCLPIAALLFCRVTAEYGLLPRLPYPAGLSFIALGLISVAVDLYRRNCSDARDPLAFFGYVLFFPVLTLGPVIPYRRFQRMLAAERPSFAAFSRGARLYALGYVERVAGAAMLMRAVNRVLAVEEGALHLPAVAVLLLLSGAALLLLICGVSDMARGVCSFYGLILLPDARLFPRDPTRFFTGLLLSLSAFLDNLLRPLAERRRPLSLTVGFFAAVLFFRCRWETLLFSLPLFLLTVPPRFIKRKNRAVTVTLYALTIPAYLLFAAGVLLPEPMLLFGTFPDDAYYHYQLFAALSDVRYLLLLLAVAAGVLIWRRYRAFALTRLQAGARTRVIFTESLLLLVAFAAALVFFLPRFPVLADRAFLRLLL